jgi:hypothetical protein
MTAATRAMSASESVDDGGGGGDSSHTTLATAVQAPLLW